MGKFKRGIGLLILGMSLSLLPNAVNADQTVGVYNGEGYSGSGAAKSGGSCNFNTGNAYCLYNNGHHKTVKATLYYYYPSGSREQIGRSIYLSNNPSSASSNLGITNITNMYLYSNLTDWNKAKDYFVRYIGSSIDKEATKNNLKGIFANQMGGFSYSSLRNKSIEADPTEAHPAAYGYRIIIEPALTVYKGTASKGNYYLKTVKEIATDGGLTCNNRWDGSKASCNSNNDAFSVALYTSFTDVGISAVRSASNATKDNGTIANEKSGYGYNIIDVYAQTCYKISTTDESHPATCENVGKNNIGTFKETIKEVACDGSQDNDVNEHGRLTASRNGCKVYCLEEAEQNFPGSYKHSANLGGYLVWPTGATKKEHNYNMYPLTFKGRRVCTITGNVSACQNVSASDLYKFDTGVEVKWQDGTSGYKTANIKKSNVEYNKTVVGNKIIIDAKVSYYLDSKFNRYVTIKDGKVHSSFPNSNFRDIGYGNLSISSRAKSNKKYYMTINTTSLGHNNTFGSVANPKEGYKCYYKIKSDNSKCICSDDTKHAGEDLSCLLTDETNNTGRTCADLQVQYCDIVETGESTIEDKYCPNPNPDNPPDPEDKYFCPDPNQDVSIMPCLKAGGTVSFCRNKLCGSLPPGDVPHCPNTNGSDDSDMDTKLLACIETKVAQGTSYNNAVSICEKAVCPIKGFNIIYRVIDLHDPFPGKNISKIVSGFNDNVKGRYPGTNWNSKVLVNNKIRSNRKVDGYTIYKKEPLYKFVLTSKQIKNIRKNYGRNYDDFKLTCKKNKSSACVSSFVHTPAISGLTGGTCSGTLTANNFYTCDD